MSRYIPVAAALALLMVGCEGSSVDLPVIDATGQVSGLVYLDFDGNGRLSGPDDAVPAAWVRVTPPGSSLELASDTTDPQGDFLMEGVPVGTITVEVRPDFLADTLLRLPGDTARYTLRADGSIDVALGITYPELSLPEVRAAATGIPVFTRGVALNNRNQSPGRAVHVEAAGVALRVIVPPSVNVSAGDSLRVQGRTGTDLGQPVLFDGATLRLVAGARDVVPRTPTMTQAATGADGLDAALVEFTSGTVQSIVTVPEGFILTVTDGSGTLRARLRTEQGFFQSAAQPGYQILLLRGLLVADPVEGDWTVVPRSTSDLRLQAPAP